jgi:hypothetical protein
VGAEFKLPSCKAIRHADLLSRWAAHQDPDWVQALHCRATDPNLRVNHEFEEVPIWVAHVDA